MKLKHYFDTGINLIGFLPDNQVQSVTIKSLDLFAAFKINHNKKKP